jgi:Kef-type K+ transport system membrane component KefB
MRRLFKLKKTYKAHVDKKLLFRQRSFGVIVAILLSISFFKVTHGVIDIFPAASCFVLGILLGLILSRMFKILWHEDKEKVVSRLDTLGIICLLIYIGIEVFKKSLFKYWLSGEALSAIGLILLTGLFLGRFLGTDRRIRAVLQGQDKM